VVAKKTVLASPVRARPVRLLSLALENIPLSDCYIHGLVFRHFEFTMLLFGTPSPGSHILESERILAPIIATTLSLGVVILQVWT
jgi:hypothetical protein